jgi:hypothetical protein
MEEVYFEGELEPYSYNEPFYFNFEIGQVYYQVMRGVYYFKMRVGKFYIFTKSTSNRWPTFESIEILPEEFNKWIKEKRIRKPTLLEHAKSLLSS